MQVSRNVWSLVGNTSSDARRRQCIPTVAKCLPSENYRELYILQDGIEKALVIFSGGSSSAA